MERRSSVQQNEVAFNDVLQDVPHFRPRPLDQSPGALYVVGIAFLHQFLHNERFEELKGHLFGEAALVELKAGTDNDYAASRVVHALTQEVLPETPLLALKHIRERLERSLTRSRYGTSAAPVVYQGVHGFLEHPFLVSHDYVGGPEVKEPLQAVVAVDDPPVKVVKV